MPKATASPMDIPPALAGLAGPARRGQDSLDIIENTGAMPAWREAAERCASVGLGGASPDEATKLLADLLPYPVHSSYRSPMSSSNINWQTHAAILSTQAAKSAGHPEWALWTPCNASPYPPLFCSARIRALGSLGADPAASKALARATHRKALEEVQAVLSLAGWRCAPNSRSGSPLHRACYAGPNDILLALALASEPSDWLALDPAGRIPLDKAYQSDNLARSIAAVRMTPIMQAGPDPLGNTPLHRLIAHLANKGSAFHLESSGWMKEFCSLAAQFGSDAFGARNLAGLTPAQLGGFSTLQQSILAEHAKLSLSEISADAPCSQNGQAAPARRL